MILHGFVVTVVDHDRLEKSAHVVASPLLENIIHLTLNYCSPCLVVLTTCSLMSSIVTGRANATEGRADEVSTVGVDLLRKQIEDTRVEFYDCAGQLDYAGMQQVFLGGRALYLLVWDVTKCHDKRGDELDAVSDTLQRSHSLDTCSAALVR